jgi:membrane protease YdiL (CAAX protease family)
MKFPIKWIRRSPVIAFYIICFAISWGLWLPFILSRGDIAELLAVVGLFGGPAVACVIVARSSPPSNTVDRLAPLWLSFFGSWIVCALILGLYQFVTSSVTSIAAYVIFAILALIPAFVIASAFSGAPGVRRTLSSLARPRGGFGWYLLAVLFPVTLYGVSVWVSEMLGWPFMSSPQPSSSLSQLAGSVLVISFYTLVYAGGLNEETGWTGFALPRLLARFNPIVSTVLVWILWMLWHVPLHMSGDFNLSPHVLIGSFFGRFLLTWLFIRTSGGILSAMLLHASVNVTSQFVPLTNASLLVFGIVAILVIVEGRMWRKLPQGSPAAFVEESIAVQPFDSGTPLDRAIS